LIEKSAASKKVVNESRAAIARSKTCRNLSSRILGLLLGVVGKTWQESNEEVGFKNAD
jgi:hypothetical protein